MIRRGLIPAAVALAGLALPGLALPLDLPPGAAETARTVEPHTDTPFPTTPFVEFDPLADRAEGTVEKRTWRVGGSSLTPLQLIRPLREQVEAAGYDILLDCPDLACGGFDFRFALDLIGEPSMHVDLGDYRYLAAADRETGSAIAIVTSRNSAAGFVHITTVTADEPEAQAEPVSKPPRNDPDGRIIDALTRTGRAVLPGLTFATGASDLGSGDFASLTELAEFLRDRPEVTVMLVGHTDAVGPLDENVALSRARAQSVVDRLIDRHGIPSGQISADGIGFLMPLALNSTEAGRRQNRRVEVVLVSQR